MTSDLVSFHSWSLFSNEATKKYLDAPDIHFHAIKYTDKSLYIWVGDSTMRMDNISCSMQTPVEPDPIGIEILQPRSIEQETVFGNVGKNMAVKLAKKLKKQVLVSFNVNQNFLEQIPELKPGLVVDPLDPNPPESNLMQLIERSLYQEIKTKPECF